MIVAIPIYVYLSVPSLDDAKKHKVALDTLLKNPFVKNMIEANQIPLHAIVVGDPAMPSQ